MVVRLIMHFRRSMSPLSCSSSILIFEGFNGSGGSDPFGSIVQHQPSLFSWTQEPNKPELIIIIQSPTRFSAIFSNGDLGAAGGVQSQRPDALECDRSCPAGAGMQNSDRKRKRGKRKRELRHDDPPPADVSPKCRRQSSSACPNPSAKGSSSSFLEKYHSGYQEQMSHWPVQPVDSIIKWLKDHSPSFVVADFGCGDARIAKCVKNVVFSIDLVSNDPSVIACDMSKTPLASSSVDVAVFCLSLMGTNFSSYLEEAYRVLKPSGWLLIAEVKSRFDPNNGGADPNIFSKCVHKLGFSTVSQASASIHEDGIVQHMFILSQLLAVFNMHNLQHNLYIVLLIFQETNTLKSNIRWPKLKPCLYKRR
ncbi:Ribosomal RNA-processing protein 8 [Nymphaea thermarum]|nr:Ribosomal RNA-processing protein 8 [Nymphaea thermarum]